MGREVSQSPEGSSYRCNSITGEKCVTGRKLSQSPEGSSYRCNPKTGRWLMRLSTTVSIARRLFLSLQHIWQIQRVQKERNSLNRPKALLIAATICVFSLRKGAATCLNRPKALLIAATLEVAPGGFPPELSQSPEGSSYRCNTMDDYGPHRPEYVSIARRLFLSLQRARWSHFRSMCVTVSIARRLFLSLQPTLDDQHHICAANCLNRPKALLIAATRIGRARAGL